MNTILHFCRGNIVNFQLPKGFESRMKRLLGKDYAAFLSGYERPLQRGLRVNTLKCTADRFQEIFPCSIEPSSFAAEGFAVKDVFRAGSDPLHHAGAYYMQEPSAMSAVTVLNPKPGEKVLDLCAAPGGKSTQIAAALRGQGLLWANEFIRSRAHILAQNIERCGVRNTVVSNTDVKTVCAGLTGFFDAVLVDAPCSGEGMFRKEPAALEQWSEDNIKLCAKRQEEILWAAADVVGTGGRLVYSTCTFAPEENECQIARFLLKHPDFELVDTGVPFGRPGFSFEQISDFFTAFDDEDYRENAAELSAVPLSKTRRIFPQDGGEGHFIALMKRSGDKDRLYSTFEVNQNDTNRNSFIDLYNQCFSDKPFGIPVTVGGIVRLIPEELPNLKGLGVLSAGVAAAEICKNRLEPCHALYMAVPDASRCTSLISLKQNDPRLNAFLKGETIDVPDCKGWTAVAVEGIVTGFGKASNGVLKNRYPKGLRLLNHSL